MGIHWPHSRVSRCFSFGNALYNIAPSGQRSRHRASCLRDYSCSGERLSRFLVSTATSRLRHSYTHAFSSTSNSTSDVLHLSSMQSRTPRAHITDGFVGAVDLPAAREKPQVAVTKVKDSTAKSPRASMVDKLLSGLWPEIGGSRIREWAFN